MKTASYIAKTQCEGPGRVDFDWRNFAPGQGFEAWRDAKIRDFLDISSRAPVPVDSLSDCGSGARTEILARCSSTNFSLYEVSRSEPGVDAACSALADFAGRLGVSLSEDHRSAEDSGVVALRTTSAPAKKGYIPYTTRPLNWHTDGYYNPGTNPVQSFILHCHQKAEAGGTNQFADPEIAYLRMREEDPGYVQALMHPQAMTIPENVEPDGTLRPASVGPVFFADAVSGRLQMRYTARTRSIAWRDDPTTRRARDWLNDWLNGDDPLIRNVRLEPGQGIVCNNVLHNRTGFEDGTDADDKRVILRVRFHERLPEE